MPKKGASSPPPEPSPARDHAREQHTVEYEPGAQGGEDPRERARQADDASRIERRFTFKNFAEAFAFVQQASDLAEREGHHPDICFGWGYATVSLYTHKIRGLHENDFIMAAKLDEIANRAMKPKAG